VGWDSTKLVLRLNRYPWLPDVVVLTGVWLIGAVCDRIWLALDRATPAWDAAEYLIGSLVFWNALQTPQWFSGSWWTNFWLLTSKIPPLFYVSAAPFISLFGKTPDQVILVFLVYSAILVGSVYLLGTYLFNRKVGLWAAAFCVVMPVLYETRLEYLLDYPLTAVVTFAFLLLTLWWGEADRGVGSRESGVAGEEGLGARGWRLEPQGAEESGSLVTCHGSLAAKGRMTNDKGHSAISTQYSALFPNPQSLIPIPFSTLRPWLLAIAAGLGIGVALITKQTAGLFLLIPIVWCGVETLWQRAWMRLAQYLVLLLATLPVWMPWYRTNWLLILTSSKRASIDSAYLEGAAPLLSFESLTFYLRALPAMASVPLIVVPLLGLVFFWRRSRLGDRWTSSIDYEVKPSNYRQRAFAASKRSLVWLVIFVVGSYILSTLNPNKDARYFAPGLPVIGVILAYGFSLLPRSWRLVRWGSFALAVLLMLVALFPLFPLPNSSHSSYPRPFFPHRGEPYPHAEVITEVRRIDPYLRSTIGVLPSTPEVNQHNVNYYGLIQNFQVYGRQVGVRKTEVAKDRRSLEWFLTKTGNQGAIRQKEAQTALVSQIEQGDEFVVEKSWTLPDQSQLLLRRRRIPTVEVKPITGTTSTKTTPPLRLEQVTVPASAPPDQPIPVTYRWSGTWQDLRNGLVILTWQRQEVDDATGGDRWLHDHGIGLGELYPEVPPNVTRDSPFQVIERLAMLPPKTASPGNYELNVVYLNRRTGETQSLTTPSVTLRIDPQARATPAPELDLSTQLRVLAGTLPQGVRALEKISNEISRINQYDPIQDYLKQTEQAMEYRLNQEPQNRYYAYTLSLAVVLQRQVRSAIAAFERVAQLDANNPYAHAYLAFVNLYDFRPGAAQQALNTAVKLNPTIPEVQALRGVAALMQLNPFGAWSALQEYQKATRQRG